MGDENLIRTPGDYSKPTHEGYRNTIELYIGNNMVPLRSDTIWLVQNGCSFHGLQSEDPNQHLKDFLKLVNSLDLDGENRERTRLRISMMMYLTGLMLCVIFPLSKDHLRTVRISIPPIEPNLAERARISIINLDDYQFDPLTPPPSPSSLFTMAAYQWMIAKTDPTQREEALTKIGRNSVPVPETALTIRTTRLRGQLHTILKDMDHYPNACLEELEAFMTLWDVMPRVEESSLETLSMDELITQLWQMYEDAEDRASNAQEEA
ncbi:hypothetical protein Tco_0587042 [Tanacetum coccineum]